MVGNLEPITGDSVHKAGDTLNGGLSHHKAQLNTHTLEIPMHVFRLEEKTKVLKRNLKARRVSVTPRTQGGSKKRTPKRCKTNIASTMPLCTHNTI